MPCCWRAVGLQGLAACQAWAADLTRNPVVFIKALASAQPAWFISLTASGEAMSR